MAKIEVTLVSGRTAKQGIGLEEGKTSKAYIDSVNHVKLSPSDIEKLGPGKNVKVTTAHGSVTVNLEADNNLDLGMAFFPYGPWANQVYASSTDGTGMPLMKGIPATIEPGKGDVLTLDEIVESLRRTTE
jgi:formylmethanofuran dehydrogenase subunit D